MYGLNDVANQGAGRLVREARGLTARPALGVGCLLLLDPLDDERGSLCRDSTDSDMILLGCMPHQQASTQFNVCMNLQPSSRQFTWLITIQ
jgi:hypothetical protein